jgi:hypothetical protein
VWLKYCPRIISVSFSHSYFIINRVKNVRTTASKQMISVLIKILCYFYRGSEGLANVKYIRLNLEYGQSNGSSALKVTSKGK